MRLDDVLQQQETAPAAPVRTVLGVPGVPAAPAKEVTVQDLLEAGPYVYLAGAAGSGKTYLARQLASRTDTLLCATTGIAAVNLGDAVTINSTLGYFDTRSLIESYAEGRLQTRLRNLIRMGVRRLCLDEVSMFEADALTTLVHALEEVATTSAYDADLSQVVQQERDDRRISLLLSGDFAQLSPINAPYAFESPEWHRFEGAIFKLEKIWRQGDQEYVKALLAIRRGDGQTALPILAPRLVQRLDLQEFDGTTIVAKNEQVDRINRLRHATLPGTLRAWKTTRSGEQEKDWVRLIPETLEVKEGALVMVLANQYDPETHELLYANGDTGVVEGKGDAGMLVRLRRTGAVTTIVPVTREWTEAYHETDQEKAAREAEEARLRTKMRKPKKRVRGMVSYMPLRLAYATTVHRSQGLSLDRVQVAIADWMFSKPSMLYVALSRCRTLEGLTIVGTERLLLGRCAVDPRVRSWV